MMTIRPARLGDLFELIAMGRAFFEVTEFASLTDFDPASFGRTVDGLMSGVIEGRLLVSEDDGAVTGMIGAILFPVYFNVGAKMAQELFWYVKPDAKAGTGQALLDDLEDEMRSAGAIAFSAATLAGLRDGAVARMLRSRGYEPLESAFVKSLQ